MKLARWESAWAEAAMQAIFPGSTEDGLAGIEGMGLRGFVAEVMIYLPFRAALGMRLAIWLVALAPVFVLPWARWRLATIARLPLCDRERVVAALVASRIYVVRSLVLILKTMGALLYGGDASVRLRMMDTSVPTSGVRRVAGVAGAADAAEPASA